MAVHGSTSAYQSACGCAELARKQIYFLEVVCCLIRISKGYLWHVS